MRKGVGPGQLCWHCFEHNRSLKALSIMGHKNCHNLCPVSTDILGVTTDSLVTSTVVTSQSMINH